jgi:class 3 adenylate cyclase
VNTYTARDFGNTVLRDFETRRTVLASAGDITARSSALETKAMGHPAFDDLPVGDKRTASIACVFLDLTDFTSRSFWDDPDEVADLAHAVLTGFIEVVGAFGGYPLGLRGDGLFAGFGPGRSDVDVVLALAACAFALRAVQEEVNPRLTTRNIEPVQARAGVDHGPIVFVRTGSRNSNDVNPLGFAANFAAKCEKTANSWEVVVGQSAATLLDAPELLTRHEKSPKSYQRNYRRREYHFHDYRWRAALPFLETAAVQLAGRPSSTVKIS